MNDLTAAIVDDDNGILDLIEQILKEEGLKTRRFNEVESLIKELDEDKTFNVIISDLVLPGKSGLDLLNEINERKLDIPFVLITGYASLDSAIAAVNRGAFYYIKKPFNIEEIRFIVTRLRQKNDLLDELTRLKKQVATLKSKLETEVDKKLHEIPTPLILNPLQDGNDVSRAFSAIEYLGRLKSAGLISDKEFGEYKGRILKRIV